MKNWYAGGTGNHQGLVIEESTGRNVAVMYDSSDAPLAAAAPAMLRLLRAIDESPEIRAILRASDNISGESIAADMSQIVSELSESAR